MRKLLFLIVVLALANLSLAAPAFYVSVDRDKTINTSQVDYVEISVMSEVNDTFLINVLPEKSSWMTLQDPKLAVEQGQTKTTRLYFSPSVYTPAATYRFTVLATSYSTGKNKTATTDVTVFKDTFLDIDKVAVTGSLRPAGMARLEIFVRNFGKISANAQVDAIILSPSGKNIYELHEVAAVDPNERKMIGKDFYLGDSAEYGEYSVKIKLSYKNGEVDSFVQRFDVMKESVIKTESTESGILVQEKRYVVKNIGNDIGSTVITGQIVGSLFYSGSQPDEVSNGMYTWNIQLEPGQEKVIDYRLDYTPIVIVAFMLVSLWYVVFKFRTMRVRKVVLQKQKIEENSEFTIGIDMKTYMNAKDVVIRDFVPSAFLVKNSHGPKPEKNKTKAGTELIWRFDELKRNEERILDYKIVPIFGVHGKVRLPRASVAFRYMSRRIEKKTPPMGIGLQQIESIPKIMTGEKRKIKLIVKKERPYPSYGRFSLAGLFARAKGRSEGQKMEEVELTDEGTESGASAE